MFGRNLFTSVCVTASFATMALAADSTGIQDTIRLTVDGSASFIVNTNVPAVSIKGKSSALKAEVTARRDAQGLHINRINAAVPVKTLQTGMGLRDEHMRKYIFTTQDGQTPDVTFQAENIDCPAQQPMTCTVNGTMTIRGASHAFTMPLKAQEKDGAFKASGEAILKLSDFGIAQPSQFGVKTSNEVQVRLDFAARPGNLASAGGVR